MNTKLNITSQRDLEKEFIHLVKLFEGKETELNWTARNSAIVRLRKIVNERNEDWRDTLLSGIRELAIGIVKTIHSMRTTFATEALLLISDISLTLGDGLDNYTIDLFLNNLLKLSGVTKRIIVDKSIEVTNTFLESIAFQIKILNILCKTMLERNIQTKQACTTFFQTILKKHADNENTRIAMEKAGVVPITVQFLKRGLLDASPKVRENCRQLYWLFHKYWPEKAEIMTQTMDPKTLSPLKRVPSSKTPLNRSSSYPHVLKSSSSTGLKLPLKRSLSSTSSSSSLSSSPSPLKKSTIPTTASRTIEPTSSNSYKLNRLSHISNVSAPASTSTKVTSASTPTRRTKSDFHDQSATISIHRMLQSKDPTENIKALHVLCDKMKYVHYQVPSDMAILPPDIPPKVSLSLAIMDFLSNHQLDTDIYKMLMSWDCLTSVIVNILAFNYYAPTLIIAREEAGKENNSMLMIFSQGLVRLKLFLKRKDPQLAQALLDLLRACKAGDSSVLDSGVKRDMWMYPSYHQSLLNGLLKWLDEIVCDYLGLAEEEDPDMLMEGSRHLNDEEPVSDQWFDVDSNISASLDLVFDLLMDYEEKKKWSGENGSYYDCISVLLAHLKLANERMFERALLAVEDTRIVNRALGIQDGVEQDLQDILDISFGSIELEDIKPEPSINEAAAIETWDNILDDDYCDDEHTGMTQDISELNFGFDGKKLGKMLNFDDNNSTKKPESIVKIEAIQEEEEEEDEEMPIPNDPPIKSTVKHIRSSPPPFTNNHGEGLSLKKRRLLRSDPETEQASNLISELEVQPKRALFLQLETVPSRVWLDENSIFYSLTDVLIEVLSTNPDPSIRLQAIRFLKSLIQDKVLVKDLLSPKLTFRLLKALFDGYKDPYSQIPIVTEEVIQSLLKEDKTALEQLWNLANEYLVQKFDPALILLLSFICKKATTIPINALKESLKKSDDILVKCFSHKNSTVRKLCVQTSAKIYQVLGDSFLKVYLAPLKSEQLQVLNYHISRAKKE